MKVHILQVGQLDTNCYLVDNLQKCIVIDPGDDSDYIADTILRLHLQPEAVLLTHGHFDHVLGVYALAVNFQIPVYMNHADTFLLNNSVNSAQYWLHHHQVDPSQQRTVDLGSIGCLNFCGLEIVIINTPGHTPGSVSFFIKKEHILFCGDLIFADGYVGRTDFRYSDKNELAQSINEIMKLDKATWIYPGHGLIFQLKSFHIKD